MPLCSITEKDGWIWIVLPGSIDMNNYRIIEDEIGTYAEKTNNIVLDMQTVSFLYSSAIGLLIRLHKKVAAASGRLCLVNVQARVKDLLGSVNLDKLFTIYLTDVEFEISQNDVWEKKCVDENIPFVCVSQIEQNLHRLILSGAMTSVNDLSALPASFTDKPELPIVIDMTGLEIIDSAGITRLGRLVKPLAADGVEVRAYGARLAVRELLAIGGFDESIHFYDEEKDALAGLVT